MASGRIWAPITQISHPPRLCIRADALFFLRARAEEGLRVPDGGGRREGRFPRPARMHAAAGARYGATPTRPQQPARARAAARLSRRGLSGVTAEGLRARGLPPGVLREGRRGWERPRGSSRTAAAAAGARRGCSRRRARRQRRLSLPQTRKIQIQVEIEIEKDYNSVETSKATSKSVRRVTGDTVLGCAPLHFFWGFWVRPFGFCNFILFFQCLLGCLLIGFGGIKKSCQKASPRTALFWRAFGSGACLNGRRTSKERSI